MTKYEMNETLRETKYRIKNMTGKNIPMSMMCLRDRKVEKGKLTYVKFKDFKSKNMYEVTETCVKENGTIISK